MRRMSKILVVASVVFTFGVITAQIAWAWGVNITISCAQVVVQATNLSPPHHDVVDGTIEVSGAVSVTQAFHFEPGDETETVEINFTGSGMVNVHVHGEDGTPEGSHDFYASQDLSCGSPSPSPTTPPPTTPPPTTPPPTTPPPTTSPTPTPTETTTSPPTETSPPPSSTSPPSPPPTETTPSETPTETLAFTGPEDVLGLPAWTWWLIVAFLVIIGLSMLGRGWYLKNIGK